MRETENELEKKTIKHKYHIKESDWSSLYLLLQKLLTGITFSVVLHYQFKRYIAYTHSHLKIHKTPGQVKVSMCHLPCEKWGDFQEKLYPPAKK